MKLTKKSWTTTNKDDFSRARVSECFLALGMLERLPDGRPKGKVPKRLLHIPRFDGFWGQDQYDLADTLKESRIAFKERIKELHPDKNPKHEKEARRVIAAHRQLEKLFKQHNIVV